MRLSLVALAGLACMGLTLADDPPNKTSTGTVAAKAAPAPAELARELMPPFKVQADGKPINVDVGHAAPCLADLEGDGKLHLLVGQFGEGKLRIYRNKGSRTEPRFSEFTWFDGKVPSG